ncbi:MAG: response regulator [Saprospiraceae bacterium]
MFENLTCLLIDDDTEDHEIFRIALEDVDAAVSLVTATRGAEALDMLTDNTRFIPDFIFIDLNMPLMDGKECLTHLRKMPHLQTVPIIVYSTSKAEYHREEYLRLGATHFYTKPTYISDLSKALTAFFQGNFN